MAGYCPHCSRPFPCPDSNIGRHLAALEAGLGPAIEAGTTALKGEPETASMPDYVLIRLARVVVQADPKAVVV